MYRGMILETEEYPRISLDFESQDQETEMYPRISVDFEMCLRWATQHLRNQVIDKETSEKLPPETFNSSKAYN